MGSFIWDGFSHGQLLQRARAVHKAALEAYGELASSWFPNVKSDMGTAMLMPARLKGWITPPLPGDRRSVPWITWVFEPLSLGSQAEVQLQLHEAGMPDHLALFEDVREKVTRLRSHTLSPARPLVRSSILEVYGASPASDLVMSWLWEDLRFLGLCEDTHYQAGRY